METASIFFNTTEFIGIVAFAASGAMISIQRKMDLLGVVFLGLVTALGGGAVRDVFLGVTPPRNFFNFEHLLCAVLTPIVVFAVAKIFRKFFFENYKKINVIMNFFDALGLASFAISGVRLTILAGYGGHDFFVVFMGIFTAVGGGMLRDIMSREKPMIFCKNVYATAALAGSVIYYLLSYIIKIPDIAAMLCAYALIVSIRLLAAKFRWDLPKVENPD